MASILVQNNPNKSFWLDIIQLNVKLGQNWENFGIFDEKIKILVDFLSKLKNLNIGSAGENFWKFPIFWRIEIYNFWKKYVGPIFLSIIDEF